MITEDYVSFEVVNLLKEKGFKEITQGYINADQEIYMCPFQQGVYELSDKQYPYPTLQMACKWLRLKHHLYVHVVIYCDQESGPYWNWFIDNTETGQTVGENTSLIQCDSPEEAYNDGIKYCLENLI